MQVSWFFDFTFNQVINEIIGDIDFFHGYQSTRPLAKILLAICNQNHAGMRGNVFGGVSKLVG